MDRVRIGVIGVAGMGAAHCREAASIPEVELKAGADVNPANIENFKAQYGVAAYDDHRKLL